MPPIIIFIIVSQDFKQKTRVKVKASQAKLFRSSKQIFFPRAHSCVLGGASFVPGIQQGAREKMKVKHSVVANEMLMKRTNGRELMKRLLLLLLQLNQCKYFQLNRARVKGKKASLEWILCLLLNLLFSFILCRRKTLFL